MQLPNPFHNTVELICPECREITLLLKIIIIVALVYVLGKYYTKNKLLLTAAAITAAYFLFA